METEAILSDEEMVSSDVAGLGEMVIVSAGTLILLTEVGGMNLLPHV